MDDRSSTTAPTGTTPPSAYSPVAAPKSPGASQGGGPPDHKRIAVIAVHGVADQAADESARAIAHLLAGIDREGLPRYEVLQEESFHVPVRPLWERRGSACVED